jgi:Domain of unknown function (DUF4349)/Putative zinc-finger
MPNDTIHEEIESWLAADVHDQLSADERAAYQQHLAGCATCRALQEDEKNMHQLLENTLAKENADPAFEERMVRGFRDRAPAPNEGLLTILSRLMRMRAVQITAVAALLLGLVQVGKMVTGEFLEPQRSAAVAQPAAGGESKLEVSRLMDSVSNFAINEKAAVSPSLELRKQPSAKSAAPLAPTAPFANSEPQPGEKDVVQGNAADATSQAAKDLAPAPPAATRPEGRKLIRNAQLELEVSNFETAVQRLTSLATEAHGFVATQSSSRAPNGKLQGTIVLKILPENLDTFLQQARSLGQTKNQTLGTEDVTKAYFDTDARLRNAKRMEERLLEMLQKKTGKVSDLLEVEKELARVREQIEQMQGELKYYDALVQYATVTISLAEKDLTEPAAFLLKETANLSLFSIDVEKTFAAVKNALQNAKAQIVQSTLERDNSGQATARMDLLLEPNESDGVIARIKSLGRVQNFNVQTERVAQNGSGLSQTAKVERDKVQLHLVISRTGEEPAVQQTTLRLLTRAVADKVAKLKTNVANVGGEVRTSTFTRNPDGAEVANLVLRVQMKNYPALLASFHQLGEVKDLTVQRNDQPGTIANPETAPAEISLQIYSPGKIVSDENGIGATLRRTLGQGISALGWSVQMIGVALAFLAPWALALGLVGWLIVRFAKRRG